MDILAQIRTRFSDPDGTTGVLEYQLLRDLALARDGSPVCEVYGLRVLRREEPAPEVYSIQSMTTDYDFALEILEKLARGQAEPANAGDIIYDLIVAQEALCS